MNSAVETRKIGDAEGIKVKLKNANLILIVAKHGYIMCGYLNPDVAEKLGDVACIVTGVKDFEDILNAKVVKLTSHARKLGIREGMSGKEALEILDR